MREFPSLERLYQRFKQKDFVVLAVNIAEPADRVKRYLVEHKLTFPSLLDGDSSVSTLYGVRGTPTRFLIDRKGKVVAGSVGPRDWASAEAQKLIENLLGADEKPRHG
ncbi:MAG: TlpA family protein disulfide reductase [candidate division NC10 bacterium]|nr:TlpA family protein disulfide reductase [candidate division NC10 bacterium]